MDEADEVGLLLLCGPHTEYLLSLELLFRVTALFPWQGHKEMADRMLQEEVRHWYLWLLSPVTVPTYCLLFCMALLMVSRGAGAGGQDAARGVSRWSLWLQARVPVCESLLRATVLNHCLFSILLAREQGYEELADRMLRAAMDKFEAMMTLTDKWRPGVGWVLNLLPTPLPLLFLFLSPSLHSTLPSPTLPCSSPLPFTAHSPPLLFLFLSPSLHSTLPSPTLPHSSPLPFTAHSPPLLFPFLSPSLHTPLHNSSRSSSFRFPLPLCYSSRSSPLPFPLPPGPNPTGALAFYPLHCSASFGSAGPYIPSSLAPSPLTLPGFLPAALHNIGLAPARPLPSAPLRSPERAQLLKEGRGYLRGRPALGPQQRAAARRGVRVRGGARAAAAARAGGERAAPTWGRARL